MLDNGYDAFHSIEFLVNLCAATSILLIPPNLLKRQYYVPRAFNFFKSVLNLLDFLGTETYPYRIPFPFL